LTLWELAACVDGFNRANGDDDMPEPMTAQEFDDAVEDARWVTVH
jgi:hypothetical protein